MLLAVTLAGCSKKSDPNLPSGASLVTDAATKTKNLKSAHIKIETDGDVGSLPLRRAEGDLVRSGDAKGSIQLSQFGVLIQYDFVVVNKDIYLKGVTGGFQKVDAATAASIYDPSAVLDPDRGIAKLLATATNPKTEARETVDGKDTYRVSVNLDPTVVSNLVPGVTGTVTGKLWLDVKTKDLVKAVLTVPGGTAAKPATVTISESNVDVPVTVSAP
jgi:lipoprotein LprG